MRRPSSIGRKLLLAVAVVALLPLVGSSILGRSALRNAYRMGVNPDIERGLERAVEGYHEYILALRREADVTADGIGRDYAVRQHAVEANREALADDLRAVLSAHENVGAVVVRNAQGEILASAQEPTRMDTTDRRVLSRRRPLDDQGAEVEVILTAPLKPFDEYQRAGEVEEVFSRLVAQTNYVANVYVWTYFAMMLVVVAVAAFLGIALSRRVTRRVAYLAQATRLVGHGDLSVHVPAQEQDEVAELTQAFNDMVRDLRESRERIEYLKRIGAWQEFARRLAHEIKNPLTPIQLAAQEILARYRGDDPAYRRQLEDAVAIVTEEVATLRRLVTEFSSFAKLPEAILESADLQDFVGELSRSIPGILESAGQDASSADVDVRCECEAGPVPVRIDAMMLKRALDNLIRNAVRAVLETHPDGGGKVVVSVRRERAWALLEVSDNGPGIPEDAATQVFDPYYTTKSDGTGLGLAIVKKVVLEHAGEVRCDRGEAGGARFRIRIPLQAADGST